MAISIFRVIQAENKATPVLACNYTNAIVAEKIVAASAYLGTRDATDIGGICVDQSENLYVSDPTQHIIVKVTEGGKVSLVAGSAGNSGNNGTLTVNAFDARFYSPLGLACDKSGNIYVADSGNCQIRKISGGKVSVVAGGGDASRGFVSGDCFTARFYSPSDVAVLPNGDIVVCDTLNHAIRKIVGGTVVTVAGGSSGDRSDVLATDYPDIFNAPYALDVDRNGNIWVCDTGNDKLKKINPRGHIYRMGGSIDGKSLEADALSSLFKALKGIAVDPSGNILLIDRNATAGGRIIRVTQNSGIGVVADLHESTSYDDGILAVASSPSGKLFIVTDATR